MKKLIYNGNSDGFYNVSSFKKFLRNSFEWDWGDQSSRVAYKDNVTLTYSNGGSFCSDRIKIHLIGKEEDISKVEDLILKAAEDYLIEN